MGYRLATHSMNDIIKKWSEDYVVYAPKLFEQGSAYSDASMVRYGVVECFEDIEFAEKSKYSFKEVLLPITETLFYFTEQSIKESDPPEKGAIIFLRSCDIHSIKVLDQIYTQNGFSDSYYERLRNRVKLVLIGCPNAYDNCFCVDMGTNKTDDYDCYISVKEESVYVDNKNAQWEKLFESSSLEKQKVTPEFPEDTIQHVKIPENLSLDVAKASMWEEYDSRCINCGRCNFVCPTCTCFTMQDIFYKDNGKAGERRRVWASCMVDGFTDMAGGITFRQNNGQRLRFRALHKIHDYKKRFGYHMCTGCGRCTDICPEYISFISCINKLSGAMEEVEENA